MKTLVSRCWLWALLLSLPAVVQAQVWVVLGSFKSQANAAAALGKVQAVASVPVRVAGFDTSKGHLYRVLAGQFRSREEAMPVLDAFRNHGYPGAWLLVESGLRPSSGAASRAVTEDKADLDALAGLGAEDGAEDWLSSHGEPLLSEYPLLAGEPPLVCCAENALN